MTLNEFKKIISKQKTKLMRKKLCENFGEKEINELKGLLQNFAGFPNSNNIAFYKELDCFIDWCESMSY